MLARALGWRVSANDEFLLVDTFELDPRAAAVPRFVNRVALFSDDAFQAPAFYFIEQCFRVSADRAGITDRVTGIGAELFENAFPRLQGEREQTFAIELEQVECVEINGGLSAFHFARLQKLERGTAPLVQRNHFAVNHTFAGGEIFNGVHNLWKTPS